MIAPDREIVAISIESLWAIFALYWLVNAFGNKRSIYMQSGRSRLLYLIALFAAVDLSRKIPMARIAFFPVSIWTQTAGILLCAAGIALAIWARRILGSNWSGLITLKENHELIRTGPYRFVRHPIYSGIILAVAGTIIAVNPTMRGLLILGVVAIGLKFKSLGEEKILLPEFPEAYPEYKREVKSLIPFLW
jgi:protein-S-isoprenylcysteine O-methyltransferase Ste14